MDHHICRYQVPLVSRKNENWVWSARLRQNFYRQKNHSYRPKCNSRRSFDFGSEQTIFTLSHSRSCEHRYNKIWRVRLRTLSPLSGAFDLSQFRLNAQVWWDKAKSLSLASLVFLQPLTSLFDKTNVVVLTIRQAFLCWDQRVSIKHPWAKLTQWLVFQSIASRQLR